MTQGGQYEDAVTEQVQKREENRRRLHEVLNPASMSAEQNKDVPNYPAKGWQDEGCTGRWDGFKALWGTYKTGSDHELKFLTYVPVDVRKERCPLLISWHGGGFVSEAVKCAISLTDST
jgi:predicted peptidase